MFSIVEMVVVLVAAALLTVQTIREDVVKRRATLLSAEGQNEAVINTALGDWVTNNYASLVAQLVAPGPTTVTPPTIDDLFTAGNLKQPHANGPFWGGTYVIQMSVGPEGCSTAPGGCHVTYVMYPSLPLMRQGQPDVDGASQIAQAGGNSFGFSKMQNSATITGLNGAWHATNPLPGTPAAAILATNGPTSDGNSVYTEAGERTLQGEGLKEAISDCGCVVGDVVSVRRLRKIKVPAIRRDGSPKIVNGKQVMWDKWLWSISK